MWTAWATLPEADASAFSSVRIASTGAAKMPEDLTRLFESRFHLELLEGYGLTEASPVVTASPPGESRVGSIGLPLSDLEVRLVDSDGDDALAGDSGEIWVKGPNVFAGYWHDDEATARALTADGWLRTGDVAVADDDGYLYLVDRAKDLIIVSGFNVYPGEVEEVIAEYPGVDDVAVVGSPHPSTGEAVKAFVVTAPGSSHEEEAIIEHCRRSLGSLQVPVEGDVRRRATQGLGRQGPASRSALSRAASARAPRRRWGCDVATRNPANSTVTPIVSVTANAVDAPSRPLSVPLAPSTSVPSGDEHVADREPPRMRGDSPTSAAFATGEDPPHGQHRSGDHDERGSARADGGEHRGAAGRTPRCPVGSSVPDIGSSSGVAVITPAANDAPRP